MLLPAKEFGIFVAVIKFIMCTVSLVPLPEIENGFVLTSNRDEAVLRKTLAPEIYSEGSTKLIYPKDQEAGGSWIGMSERKRTLCLLNGGFKKHLRNPPYRKSRGLVVRELLAAPFFPEAAEKYHYEGIEPFTAVVVDYSSELQFLELVWDGNTKHLKELPLQNTIWSSSLLYSSEEVALRKQKFEAFEKHHPLTAETLLEFHSSSGGEGEEGLVIDRGFLKTCSITQITKTPVIERMRYLDLASGRVSHTEFPA